MAPDDKKWFPKRTTLIPASGKRNREKGPTPPNGVTKEFRLYRNLGLQQDQASVLTDASGNDFSPATEHYKNDFEKSYFPNQVSFDITFNQTRGNNSFYVPAISTIGTDNYRFYKALSPNDQIPYMIVLHTADCTEDGQRELQMVVTHYDGKSNPEQGNIGTIVAKGPIEGNLEIDKAYTLKHVEGVTTKGIDGLIKASLEELNPGIIGLENTGYYS